MSEKKLLFSLTKKDFEIEFFRGSGAGGQKKNKTSSACRIKHKESGASGECQEFREQHKNKETAFKRMIESKEFKIWHKLKTSAMLLGFQDIEKKIDEDMKTENIKVEYYDAD